MQLSAQLDDLDKRILQQLQIDNAISNQDLAHLVHASTATCLRRVKNLVKQGVITRQVAILSSEKLGPSLTAIVEITLDHQGSEQQVAFEQLVAGEIAVQQCYRVSPGPDFILVIQVSDMPAYHALAHRLFASHSNIRNVRSFFSMLCSKFETRIPLGH